MNERQRTVIQGEILALLHDIGKESWDFITAGLKDSGTLPAHTSTFLKKQAVTTGLSNVLRKPLQGWLHCEGQSAKNLAALLVTHHFYKEAPKYFDGGPFPPEEAKTARVVPLVMSADTADSLFSKGSESKNKSEEEKQKSMARRQSAENVHLASPLGEVERRLSQTDVDTDAAALAEALKSWAQELESWDDDRLLAKRDELRDILRDHTRRHLAETRLPDNDVSLWQHSYSVASLFKALLAGYLWRGNWENRLSRRELALSKQKLSLLGVQWGEAAFQARSMRSFEIEGRRRAIESFAARVKTLVEKDLALGNEIYRDHKGLCFMVCDLEGDLPEGLQLALDTLRDSLEAWSNEFPMDGTLPWKIMHCGSGLFLNLFHEFWERPFGDAGDNDVFGPAHPRWMEAWKAAQDRQICPRCGLHAIAMSSSRSGSDSDNACEACRKFSDQGRQGRPGAEKFWDDADSRLALIQGVLPQDALQSGLMFRHVLKGEAHNWDDEKAKIAAFWEKCLSGNLGEDDAEYFRKLCGMDLFGTEMDGWCAHVPEGASVGERMKAALEGLVFGVQPGSDQTPESDQTSDPAERLLYWALSQTPAPSRLGRLWECAGNFMTDMAELPAALGLPCVELTRDLSSFQILVYASDALEVLYRITEEYAHRFARVRHVLPLHLSAAIFRNKAPLYLAMDAARRFRVLAEDSSPQLWTLESRESGVLTWRTPQGLKVRWTGMEGDAFRSWFLTADGCRPVHVSRLEPGKAYQVRPSTFDYEVLDASIRRYDIAYENGRRRHFMTARPYPSENAHEAKPRPYPLEILCEWRKKASLFAGGEGDSHQRKTAVELLARLHQDWPDCRQPVFRDMAADILKVTLDRKSAEALLESACDASFFDLCEWYDFIGKNKEILS